MKKAWVKKWNCGFISPGDKQKEFTGILKSFDADSVIIETEEEEKVFARSEIALIRLAFDF